MKKIALLVFFTSVFTDAIHSQQISLKKPDGKEISSGDIDKLIKQLMDTAEVTGLCLGVINNNKIVYVNTYGYRNK